MRHHNRNKKFGRDKDQRKALMVSLALSLILKGRIKTTLAKAKSLRPFIELLVTRAKKDNLYNRMIVSSRLSNRKPETKKLFKEIAPEYQERNGGYTRIIKMGSRLSDGAPMAIIEFV